VYNAVKPHITELKLSVYQAGAYACMLKSHFD